MSLKQDLRDVLAQAEAHGFQSMMTAGGHIRLTPPDGGPLIFCASTPSDYRGIRNLLARLRRAGLPR